MSIKRKLATLPGVTADNLPAVVGHDIALPTAGMVRMSYSVNIDAVGNTRHPLGSAADLGAMERNPFNSPALEYSVYFLVKLDPNDENYVRHDPASGNNTVTTNARIIKPVLELTYRSGPAAVKSFYVKLDRAV